MIIGILSDTHGRADTAATAVRLLRERGAEYLVHCGDVCGNDVLDTMIGTPSCFVFGNNDYDHDDLRRYANIIGITCLGVGGIIELGGRRIGVTHGDDARELARLCQPNLAIDYLLTGHSHVPHDRRVGAVRWINPGALYRAAVKTVATLDLTTAALSYVDVPSAPGRGV